MLVFLQLVLFAGALLGHCILWIVIDNRIHATALPYRTMRVITKIVHLTILVIPAAALLQFIIIAEFYVATVVNNWLALTYLLVCYAALLAVLPRWIWQRVTLRPATQLESNHTRRLDIGKQLGRLPVTGSRTRLLAKIPGNQICQLHVQDKVFRMPGLASELDGLSIVHLSDLHFTGRIEKPYFEAVVQQANELNGDFVVVTGDIVDRVDCMDWIPDTLGRLQSRYGKYYVLGNHDTRIPDSEELKSRLNETGMVHVGGRVERITVNGGSILIAGNELPWFGPAPDMASATDTSEGELEFKILLSHSPDQITWARENQFDLMLAGHTHGGQIRLPLIGPIVSPSRFGVKYASGIFFEQPTLLHVSRGISGCQPIRLNCPPELARIILKREK